MKATCPPEKHTFGTKSYIFKFYFTSHLSSSFVPSEIDVIGLIYLSEDLTPALKISLLCPLRLNIIQHRV